MERFSTHTASPLEWTELLRLWLINRDKLYGNFTVDQFIKYIMGNAPNVWVGRNVDGLIEAFTVAIPRGDTLFVEAWAGPTKYVRGFDTQPFQYIEYQRAGKTYRHKLI